MGDWSTSNHLVDQFQSFDAVMHAGRHPSAVEAAGQSLKEGFGDQGRLAAARHPGHADEGAEGKIHRQVLEIVGPRPDQPQDTPLAALAAFGRQWNLAESGKVLSGQAGRVLHDFFGRSLGHHGAAVDAGAGPHVDDVIGRRDGVLVVFDDDDGVAQIAQAAQGFEQPVVVALVQTDGWFVEHVQHAGEAGTDLRG